MKLFSTSCETRFLGWDAPLLPRAASHLRQRYANRRQLDLSPLICVLPTLRGVHRLAELLRKEADTEDLHYTPPEIITVGQLAERLYQPPQPVAIEMEQTLAWARALRSTHPGDLQPLIPSPPAPGPIGPWLELASALRRLHEEISANRLTFAEVMEAAESQAEQRRWRLLAELFRDYQAALSEAGLSDPHHSRLEAIAGDHCRADRTIVLIGTSDLSDMLVAMLRSLGSELIAMVAAPKNEAQRFDEFGCVDTAGWSDHQLPLTDEQVVSAGDIADQTAAVAEALSEFAPEFTPDQVTVGVTDESHVAPVAVQLRGCGVSTYRHLGWTVAETSVGRLLDLTATYLQRRTWQSLAALVRHAEVAHWITAQLGQQQADGWLTQLDQLLSESFPVRVPDGLTLSAAQRRPLAAAVGERVEQWLSIFGGPERSLARWSGLIDGWLAELFAAPVAGQDAAAAAAAGAAVVPGSRTTLAIDAARRIIARFAKLSERLDLTVSGGWAIEMLAGYLTEVRVIEHARPHDVEILGWLDLALDDAQALVVIGLNHPFVPAAITSDPFLPGELRSRLRMADNQRRYVRDVYAMHLMLTTRRAVRFIVGRTSADQTPTPPSRLLAAAPAADAARRVRQLLGQPRASVAVHHRWDDCSADAALPIPDLGNGPRGDTIETLSVTAFRDYLACPYRFYLRHVLKLRPLDDASSELAANQFGDLVHGALERFGQSPDRDETQHARIEALLIASLHQYASEYFGSSVSSAVTLQIAQAERRLKVVARQQAERIADGWKIHACEASVGERSGAGVDVDGRRMGLRGRIDRIDRNEATGQWAILDYKTHGQRPEKKHLRQTDDGDQWIDLQLPLYRMMIPYLGIDADPADVGLGYFNIAEKDEETKINIAAFSESQLRAAEELIRDCIRGIWAGRFEPTRERVPFDDYEMILQTGVASRLLDRAESMSDQETDG